MSHVSNVTVVDTNVEDPSPFLAGLNEEGYKNPNHRCIIGDDNKRYSLVVEMCFEFADIVKSSIDNKI